MTAEPVVLATDPPAATSTEGAAAYEPTFPAIIPETPIFTRDLESSYYLNEAGEADLVCSVVSADMLTFRCNNVRLQEDQQASCFPSFLLVSLSRDRFFFFFF